MRFMTPCRRAGLTPLLLSLISLGIPVLAQQPKPDNAQLPDPNSQTQQQPTAGVGSASQSSPSTESSQGQMGSQEPGQGQISASDEQTFTGKIVKSKGNFVLKDATTKTVYQLDKQDGMKQFEGKEVKVTGTLDSSNNTIHVSTVEPVSS
jgi:Protein of unknown function (DUF5818)